MQKPKEFRTWLGTLAFPVFIAIVQAYQPHCVWWWAAAAGLLLVFCWLVYPFVWYYVSGQDRLETERSQRLRKEIIQWLKRLEDFRTNLEADWKAPPPDEEYEQLRQEFMGFLNANFDDAQVALFNNLPPLKTDRNVFSLGTTARDRLCHAVSHWEDQMKEILKLPS